MAKGLHNTGSTIAHMNTMIFKEDKSILAYVGNIVVQKKLKQDHIEDLHRAFSKLHNARLKLNLEKCIFGVRENCSVALSRQEESRPT
jgi:hypothetical protein